MLSEPAKKSSLWRARPKGAYYWMYFLAIEGEDVATTLNRARDCARHALAFTTRHTFVRNPEFKEIESGLAVMRVSLRLDNFHLFEFQKLRRGTGCARTAEAVQTFNRNNLLTNSHQPERVLVQHYSF